jgi:serine phosphatase RsbU (regulator of sigma subunit)
MNQRIIISIFLLCLASLSFSQNIFRLTTVEEANEKIQNYIEVYTDSTNSLDFDQISSEEYRKNFIPVSKFEEETSYLNTYWLHFILDYDPVKCVPMGMQLSGQNYFIEVYTVIDGSVQMQKTGTRIPGISNDEIFPQSNYILIKGAGQIEYYLRLTTGKFRHPSFKLTFYDFESDLRETIRSPLFLAFFQGVLFLMVLYGLFLYYHKRETVYLFYTLYTVFASLWALNFLVYQFIYWLPRGIYAYSLAFGYISFYFYLSFVRSFLNTSFVLPKWDRVLKIQQLVLLIAATVLHILPSLFSLYYIIHYFHAVVFIVLSILVISFVVKIFLSDIPFAYIIWIGTSLLILGLIAATIQYFAGEWDLFKYVKIGILLELVVFSYGISLRYKITDEEKREYQARLIDQLKENAEIQERAKKELEGKVKRRTVEIAQKNNLLSQQNEEIEAQRDELEIQRDVVLAQKNEIVDSITYAQRIQASMLPPETYFTELLNENFIFYNPRDIVSGDFYWIKQVNMSIILVAADCTGHGVPGALLSMLGMSYLDEIVERREITQANQVLNELRNQIKHSLRQHGQSDESRDGIDLALCVFDLKNRVMQYSGANNPLYIIKNVNGEQELKEIKADQMPVGYYQGKDKSFTNHSIQLEMGDTFYIFSDGFVDQKGGKDNKKYLSKNFKKLLLDIHEQAMPLQKEILDKTLTDWMGDNSQMDDVLVIGVRV